MHVVKEQAILCQRIYIGCLDGSAVTTHLAEAGVVLDDEQNVGGALFRSQRLGPGGLRYIERSPDHAVRMQFLVCILLKP